MKKKKSLILASLLTAGVLATSARFYKKSQEEQKKREALLQVRAFFSSFGEIATVFIYEERSTQDCLVGGVVLEDRSVYLFENHQGDISYMEEESCE